MARALAATISLLLLSACASAPPAPVVRAAFVAPDRVEVSVRHDEPLAEAALLRPDGSVAATAWGRPRGRAAPARPQIGVSASGGSASGIEPGLSIGLPLSGWFSRRAAPVESSATLIVPEPAAYGPGWAIELRFDDGPPLTRPGPPK